MCHGRLTPDQAEAVFLSILQTEAEDLKLRKLLLRGNDLSSVPPAVLSGAVNKLEQLDLVRTELRPTQVIILHSGRF